MESKRNYTVDILRYISSIMVIAIHSAPFEHWNADVYSFIQRISAFAVPFFFAISGFYFLSYSVDNVEKRKKSVKHLISTYVFWSIIYFIVAFIRWGYEAPLNYVKEMFLAVFTTGSYYHLWFMPVLIYAMVLYCLVRRFFKRGGVLVCEFLLLIVGTLLMSIGVKTPVELKIVNGFIVNFVKALALFSLGGVISFVVSKKKENIVMGVAGALIIFAYLVDAFVKLGFLNSIVWSIKMEAFVVLAILLALRFPISVKNEKAFEWMAPASRFSYFSHELFLQLYRLVLVVLPLYLQNTVLFVLTVVTTTGITVLLYRRKSVRKLFE